MYDGRIERWTDRSNTVFVGQLNSITTITGYSTPLSARRVVRVSTQRADDVVT